MSNKWARPPSLALQCKLVIFRVKHFLGFGARRRPPKFTDKGDGVGTSLTSGRSHCGLPFCFGAPRDYSRVVIRKPQNAVLLGERTFDTFFFILLITSRYAS